MKVGSRKGKLRAVAAAAVALGFMLTGCDSGSGGGGEDGAALVKQSAEAMRGVTGAHLVLTAEGKIPNLKATKLEGDLSNKPAPVATGTIDLNVGDKATTAKFVYVDGKLYSDAAEPGRWVNYGPGDAIYNVSVILNPDKGLANLLANFQDAKVKGTEDVNGVKATKVSGTSSSNDVMVLSGSRMGPQTETQLPTTVWIAEDGTHHLLKAELEPVQGGKVTLTLSDFNKSVTATKPI